MEPGTGEIEHYSAFQRTSCFKNHRSTFLMKYELSSPHPSIVVQVEVWFVGSSRVRLFVDQ